MGAEHGNRADLKARAAALHEQLVEVPDVATRITTSTQAAEWLDAIEAKELAAHALTDDQLAGRARLEAALRDIPGPCRLHEAGGLLIATVHTDGLVAVAREIRDDRPERLRTRPCPQA
ncbi:hypothetical protein BH18ACT9_BH18ACT9_22720 [soil metagenome]